MSLQLDWVGLAEGTVIDTRQVLSLVGVNQNVFRVDQVPASISTHIAVLISESPEAADGPAGDLVGHVSLRVCDPDGREISSTANTVSGERKLKDIPATFVLAAMTTIRAEQLGRYSVEVVLDSQDGESSRRDQYLYVTTSKE
jgi:hypothetical protein